MTDVGRFPPAKGEDVMVPLSSEEMAAVDAWRDTQDDKPNRGESVRRLMAIALQDRRQKPR